MPKEPRVIEITGLLREAIVRAAEWEYAPLNDRQQHIAAVILDEIAGSSADAFTLPMPNDPRLLRIATALADAPADTRSLEDWANWAHAAPRTVSRRFVSETGLTFTAWRQRARLVRALELLAAGEPVTNVAYQLGYDNVSAFIALFRRTFGTTPGRYFGAEPTILGSTLGLPAARTKTAVP
jgi:AraC-like DNA-binding protein